MADTRQARPDGKPYTVTEAAETSGYTARRIRQLLAAGHIAGHRQSPRGKWLIPPEEIDRLLTGRQAERCRRGPDHPCPPTVEAEPPNETRRQHVMELHMLVDAWTEFLRNLGSEISRLRSALKHRHPYHSEHLSASVSPGGELEIDFRLESSVLFRALQEHLPNSPMWDEWNSLREGIRHQTRKYLKHRGYRRGRRAATEVDGFDLTISTAQMVQHLEVIRMSGHLPGDCAICRQYRQCSES